MGVDIPLPGPLDIANGQKSYLVSQSESRRIAEQFRGKYFPGWGSRWWNRLLVIFQGDQWAVMVGGMEDTNYS
jgi:hypothetical protein